MKIKLKPSNWQEFEFVINDNEFTVEELANMDRERAERILKTCVTITELFHLFDIEVNDKEV